MSWGCIFVRRRNTTSPSVTTARKIFRWSEWKSNPGIDGVSLVCALEMLKLLIGGDIPILLIVNILILFHVYQIIHIHQAYVTELIHMTLSSLLLEQEDVLIQHFLGQRPLVLIFYCHKHPLIHLASRNPKYSAVKLQFPVYLLPSYFILAL